MDPKTPQATDVAVQPAIPEAPVAPVEVQDAPGEDFSENPPEGPASYAERKSRAILAMQAAIKKEEDDIEVSKESGDPDFQEEGAEAQADAPPAPKEDQSLKVQRLKAAEAIAKKEKAIREQEVKVKELQKKAEEILRRNEEDQKLLKANPGEYIRKMGLTPEAYVEAYLRAPKAQPQDPPEVAALKKEVETLKEQKSKTEVDRIKSEANKAVEDYRARSKALIQAENSKYKVLEHLAELNGTTPDELLVQGASNYYINHGKILSERQVADILIEEYTPRLKKMSEQFSGKSEASTPEAPPKKVSPRVPSKQTSTGEKLTKEERREKYRRLMKTAIKAD